jgi:hypothetical protein
MTSLTCNQLMILLACYRGSQLSDVAVGTFEKDVRWLTSLNYLDNGALTEAGSYRVEQALGRHS